jgi:hypothetical protein
MSRHISAAFILVFSCILATPVHAQKNISTSGNEYLACSVIDKPQQQFTQIDFLEMGMCEGFMLGLKDGVGLSFSFMKKDDSGSMEDMGICFPAGDTADLGQIIRIVLKYIRQNPEQAHLPSAALVLMATKAAFPCAKPILKP